jgi:acyl carrier protein
MSAHQERIVDDVSQIVNEYMPAGARRGLTAGSNLFDYGLDSVAMISIIVALEERFKCRFSIDDLDLEKFSTVENIARVVQSKALLPDGAP